MRGRLCGFAILALFFFLSADANCERCTLFSETGSVTDTLVETPERIDSVDEAPGISNVAAPSQVGDAWIAVAREAYGVEPEGAAAEPARAGASAVYPKLFSTSKWYIYTVGSNPEAVALGDFNGDGRTDIALTTSFLSDELNDYHLFVFMQDEAGRLRHPAKYPAGNGSSVDVGDFNGDGKTDIVVSASTGIGVFYQDGSGGFGPMVSYASRETYFPTRLKVGDFNDDGLQDVFTLIFDRISGCTAEAHLQKLTGGFDNPVGYDVDCSFRDDVDVGDVNDDGLQDVVVLGSKSTQSSVQVLLQTPFGTFDSPISHVFGKYVLGRGAAVGDVNSDGLQDIAVSLGGNRPDSMIGLFLQDVTGIPEFPLIYPSHDIPSAVEIADVDMDRKNDLVVLHDGWGCVGVYPQQTTDEVFDRELLYYGPATANNPQAMKVGDINGDGTNDIVMADFHKGLVVFYNQYLAVKLVSPKGSDTWPVGSTQTIRWKSRAKDKMSIDISRDGGASWKPLFSEIPNRGLARWKISGAVTDAARIRVRSASNPRNMDITDGDFVISGLKVKKPNGGETWQVGSKQTIRWESAGVMGQVSIELSRDGGKSWETLFAGAGNDRVQSWAVKGPATKSALMRVRSATDERVLDLSDRQFSIR